MTTAAEPGLPRVWLDAATLADVDEVVRLEKLSYPEPWSRRQFEGALQGEAGQKVLALRDAARKGGIVGYVVVQTVVDELHVHNVAVDPELRRRGLARRLLNIVMGWGARRGSRQVYLEVRRSNVAALRLYESLGFERIGLRKGYYNRPREDALVLRLALPVPH